jgi:Protein of unknown function (DUF3592)
MARFFVFLSSLAAFSAMQADAAFASTTVDADAKPYLVFGGVIAGIALFGLGLFLISNGRNRNRVGRESEHWPVADGKVLASIVAKKSYPPTGIFHVPRVRYSYAVAGQHYEGDVICPGIEQFGLGSELQAHAKADQYPVGENVSVHYDPADPAVAVLETTQIGAARNIFGGAIAMALGIFIFGLAVVISALPTG